MRLREIIESKTKNELKDTFGANIDKDTALEIGLDASRGVIHKHSLDCKLAEGRKTFTVSKELNNVPSGRKTFNCGQHGHFTCTLSPDDLLLTLVIKLHPRTDANKHVYQHFKKQGIIVPRRSTFGLPLNELFNKNYYWHILKMVDKFPTRYKLDIKQKRKNYTLEKEIEHQFVDDLQTEAKLEYILDGKEIFPRFKALFDENLIKYAKLVLNK